MPYISTNTNIKISSQQEFELKKAFAKAIELIPGKSEQWLMLKFNESQRMWFAGDNAPMCMLEVENFGSSSQSSYDALTAELTSIVSNILDISPIRIYVKYEEIEQWGWNGSNF